MAVKTTKTESVMDKATNVFKKGFATFDKMMFLEESQQDSLNAAATNFEVINKAVNINIEEIEESISKMTDVKQIKEMRSAMEGLKNQNMQDTAKKIAAGEDVGIEQAKQFSKDLLTVKKSFKNLDTNIEISFDDMMKTYAKQTMLDSNSDKAQEGHFRSLLIALTKQSSYLKEQVAHLEKQDELSEEQIALLEANKRDLTKINAYSSETAKYSKMGPEGLKKNKEAIDSLMVGVSNEVFESKMYTSFNQIDNSIQSLGVDSENLNETMNDLTEAQISGKEVIAGSAKELKKGAKGMVSSMVLSSLGLGGLDEALGISEKFANLELFGKQGLFGKKGLLSNVLGMVKGGGGGMAPGLGGGLPGISTLTGGVGMKGLMTAKMGAIGAGGLGTMAGAALGVGAAGAAGYAVGTGINKLIDKIGGEKNFLGASAARAIYGGSEREANNAADVISKWRSMSDTSEGIDLALDEIDDFIQVKEEGWTSKAEEQSIEQAQRMAEVLKRKKKKLEAEDKNIKEEIKIETSEIIGENEDFDRKKQSMKTEGVGTKKSFNQSDKIVYSVVEEAGIDFENVGVTPKEVSYLPKVMEDNTNLIIKNSKEERERIVKAQNPTPIIIPPSNPPVPVDTSKSVDDMSLTILNNDIFG